ncbi:MAG: RtcB family protein, partial [Chloroflexi bacterium]|nr:RtcB family protein [Chloroflexota bacterium]
IRGEELRAQLEEQHITVRAASISGLAEEAPDAYKRLEDVVRIVDRTGISRKVARTRPMGVMKG